MYPRRRHPNYFFAPNPPFQSTFPSSLAGFDIEVVGFMKPVGACNSPNISQLFQTQVKVHYFGPTQPATSKPTERHDIAFVDLGGVQWSRTAIDDPDTIIYQPSLF